MNAPKTNPTSGDAGFDVTAVTDWAFYAGTGRGSRFRETSVRVAHRQEDCARLDSLVFVLARHNPVQTLVEPIRQSDKRFKSRGHSATLYL